MPDSTSSHSGSPLDPQEAFLQLVRLDLSALSLTEVLTRVAELAKATVAGAQEVSVTLIDGDTAHTVAFTGDLAVQLDEHQYAQGFGPCMDAAAGGETIGIEDTAVDDRYRDFGPVAARAGIGSTLSVGMPVPQRVVGALNFYGGTTAAFDDAAVNLAQAFAGYGAVALVNAALIDSKSHLANQLKLAMAARATIEQAKGVLMARAGYDADQAFAELVRRSQHANRKLDLVAADLLGEVRRTTPGS